MTWFMFIFIFTPSNELLYKSWKIPNVSNADQICLVDAANLEEYYKRKGDNVTVRCISFVTRLKT